MSQIVYTSVQKKKKNDMKIAVILEEIPVSVDSNDWEQLLLGDRT